MKNKLERITELKDLIKKYDQQYYGQGFSEISDAEYDRLYEEYLQLETEFPEFKSMEDTPTRRVGTGELPAFGLPKFTHKSPLLSIENKSKELSVLRSFYDSLGGDGIEVIVQPKLDGITCNINYENGRLVNAATRGNGTIGELITEQFKNSETRFPDLIPDGYDLEIRGEAIVPYDFFKEELLGYSCPRSVVNSLRGDPDKVKGKQIQVMFYDIGNTTLSLDDRDSVNVRKIKALGFQSVPTFVATCWDSLREIVETRMDGLIQEIDGFNVLVDPDGVYPQAVCDGLVIKVSSLKQRLEIGSSSKGPKWAFAFKFPSLQAETRIDHVEWQVGKSGRVTPVAVFDEISLGGTKITRATLNNIDYMHSLPLLSETRHVFRQDSMDPWGELSTIEYGKPIDSIDLLKCGDFIVDLPSKEEKRFRIEKIEDPGFWVKDGHLCSYWFEFEEDRFALVCPLEQQELQIDDLIVVERSNDVIPRIIAIKRHQKYTYPDDMDTTIEVYKRWDSFKEPTVCPICGHPLTSRNALLYCTNPACSAQIKGKIEHFASRDAMNITGLGEGIIDILTDLGFLSDLPSIYSLKEHADELISLPRFGKTKVKNLLSAIEASKTPELWQFIYALSIEGIGHRASKDIADHFLTQKGVFTATMEELSKIESMGPVNASVFYDFINERSTIDMLVRLNQAGVSPKEKKITSQEFQGMSFVITGTLENPRKYYQELIESKGGKVSGSVSKKTSVVLIGTDAGSKEDKARKLAAEGAEILILDDEGKIMDYLNQ